MSNFIDISGQRFGKLKVLSRAENSNGGQARWLCQCDCGNKVIALGTSLRNGHTTSCGCKKIEAVIKRNTKHGETNTRLYNIWNGIKKRVGLKNTNDFHYKYYAAKGVKICDEWRDFLVFKEWALSHGYNDNLSIDRIDCNGDYCPDNCRWANLKQQANNKTSNVFISYNSEIKTAQEWCDETGLNYSTFMYRYYKGLRDDELFAKVITPK